MRLNEKHVEEILALRNKGSTVREIAERFGISERRVYQVLKNPHIHKPGRHEKTLDREVEMRIINLRENGKCISEITENLRARGINVSYYAVWKTVRRWEMNRLAKSLFGTKRDYENLIGVFIGRIKLKDGAVKFFVVENLISGRVLEHGFDAKLRNIVARVEKHAQPGVLFVLQRSPPLVPTRGKNALINLLEERNIDYVWITRKQVKSIFNPRKRFNCPTHLTREEFIRWFEREGVDALENLCKRLSARIKEMNGHGCD
ncbi:helix-turn-helix domain-containing protein [Thermococcus sp.]|uniref:helix-turn-helix domain-containing protein n=1 Tax=Thermococcus sp. TaxID=35749 RepID=UPI0026316FC8|nr:helix-turn-helix domain-containing protein [Thermococcus sp.]